MMTVVGLDFTSDLGGMALWRDGYILGTKELDSSASHASRLFLALDQLLSECAVDVGEVNCFAGAAGPGSFSGVRVTLAAAKGLAESLGKGAMGISNLRALAFFGNTPRRAVLNDARRGEAFAAIYNADLQVVGDETIVSSATAWLEANRATFDQVITQNLGAIADTVIAPTPLASAVAAIAARDLQGGLPHDPILVDANYVRRSDARGSWTDRHGT